MTRKEKGFIYPSLFFYGIIAGMIYQTKAKILSDRIDQAIQELAILQLKNPIHPKQNIEKACTNRPGLYRIHHHDDFMSTGYGNLNSRRARHVRVFKKEGKADVSSNGRSSDSPVASKMYDIDSDINNWHISYQIIDGEINRDVADAVMKRMELIVGKENKPLLCAEHMLGK